MGTEDVGILGNEEAEIRGKGKIKQNKNDGYDKEITG